MKSKDIRFERTRRLEQSLSKKINHDFIIKASKKELLEALINISEFNLSHDGKNWIINNCKSQREVMYSFKLFFQMGLNNSRTYSIQEDIEIINKHINFSLPKDKGNTDIGKVYTLGIINDIVEEIEIRCFTTPSKKDCGKLVCTEDISIRYPQLHKLIQNYNTYIKLYPQKPENTGEWEVALELAIYTSIYNKILPSKYIVLGGITEEGIITPTGKNIIQSIDKNQSIIISSQNKNDIASNNRNSNYIYINHINEMISQLKPVKNNENTYQKDFLCNRN